MENLLKFKNYKGYIINVYPDTESDSPREWDNLGTIFSNHRNWNPDGKSIEDLIREVGGNIYDRVIPWDKIAEKYIYCKVWMYDHSGQTIKVSGSDPFLGISGGWDSGLCGVIAVLKEDVRKEWNWKKLSAKRVERIEGYLANEIQTLDKYMQGEVYYYEIENESTGEVIDSCCGWYNMDEAIVEAEGVIDNIRYNKYGKFEVGAKVKWNDPAIEDYDEEDREEVLNREFTIVDCPTIDEMEDDSIILINDGTSDAEVYPTELIAI